jgi:hypothetical protein
MHPANMLPEVIKTRPNLVPNSAGLGGALIGILWFYPMRFPFVSCESIGASKFFDTPAAVRNIAHKGLIMLQHVFSATVRPKDMQSAHTTYLRS